MPENSMPSANGTDSSGSASKPLPTLLQQRAGIRNAHEAVMLEDARELLAQQRKLVASHNSANGLEAPGDDMGSMHIGDTVIHNAPPEQRPALSGLAKAGIAAAAAAALGGGVGLPLALPSIINALKPAAAAPATPAAGSDTDTVFDLFIGGPKQ